MKYLTYQTQQGDRWDTIAYKYYGDAYRYQPILDANPEIRILPRLPAGVVLKIPLLDLTQYVTTEALPPWMR